MALRRPAVVNNTYRYYEELIAGDDLNLVGQKIVNLADPTGPQDAATKAYVDAVASGLDIKQSVRLATTAALAANTAAGTGVGKTLTADANGALSVDGVAVAVGNRILVKDEATGEDNGIYVVTDAGSAGTAYVLTRATDADQNVEVTAGMFMFVAEGTVNADTGWVLITNDAIVVDTTSLAFSQFSSATALTFDQGLLKTGSSITIELDTDADAQGAGAGGGSSGLEFDVNSAAGQLRAAVNPTGGIQRTASGLAVELNGGTLLSGASGLSVFSSPREVYDLLAGEALTQFHPVAKSATNNQVVQATAAIANEPEATLCFGVTLDAAAAGGDPVRVQSSGPVAGALSGATAGAIYYLQAAGGVGTTAPTGTNRCIEIGFAINATDLMLRIIDRGREQAP